MRQKTTTGANGGGGWGTLGSGPAYSASIVQPLEFGGRIALRRAIADRQIDLAVLGCQHYTATLAARARTLADTLFTAGAKADGADAVAARIEGVAAVTVQRDIAGPSDMALFRDESFGPVVAVTRAGDEAHAIDLANDTDYGLSAAVFTRDTARGLRVARRTKSGICHVNGPTVHDEAQMPFGGTNASGNGHFPV